jgi:putative transposase
MVLAMCHGPLRLFAWRHSAEQIVRKLREAEVELARGASIKDACRKLAISEHTYYRWRREYGGVKR